MAIAITRYVDIISGVGGGAVVAQRQLIGRLFTNNNIVPPGTIVTFSGAPADMLADVGAYFGTSSSEYLRAQFYANFISKTIVAPQAISFSRWVDTPMGSMIFGVPATYALGTFTAITSGGFRLTLGGFTFTVSGVNLSGAASLAAVAADIQAAVRAESGGGTAWTSATVSYDATNKLFDLVSGTTGADTIAITAAPSGTDLAGPLGWLTGAVLCNGSGVETITQTLTDSAAISDNFGSFLFMPTLNTAQILESSTWNSAQNVKYQYCVPVTASDAAAVSAAIDNLSGSDMTLTDPTNFPNEFDEMCPMMILAATYYTQRNATQNYMFYQFDLTPKVMNDADANTYDALDVNYYGQTQTAGQLISLYQRGVMTGLPTAPTDQNTYANEQWLKSAATAAIMTLFLALPEVSANAQGRGQLLTVLQAIVNQALFNGTISVGKTLTTTQQLFITNATGDPKAWYQVQNQGYWLNVTIVQVTVNGNLEYQAVYTLIYSKNDVIRKVNGTHVLI